MGFIAMILNNVLLCIFYVDYKINFEILTNLLPKVLSFLDFFVNVENFLSYVYRPRIVLPACLCFEFQIKA